MSCLKSLKLPSGMTKLCNFVNEDYDYDYDNIYIFLFKHNHNYIFINKIEFLQQKQYYKLY